MWLFGRAQAETHYSPYRFAAFRMVLGVLVVLFAAWSPAVADVSEGSLSEVLLGLGAPAWWAVRGSAVVAGIGLAIGSARRLAAASVALLVSGMAVSGQLDVRIGTGLVLFALMALAYPGPDKLAPRRDPSFGSSATRVALWYRIAWVCATVQLFAVPLIAGSPATPWVLATGLVLMLRIMLRGPLKTTALLAFGIAAAGLCTTTMTLALLLCWLVALLLVFDERWLPPRRGAEPIYFFDGVCTMCNDSVQLIIEEEASPTFRFAPIQGETAHNLLDPSLTADINTFVVYEGGNTFVRSDAALRAGQYMGGFWRALSIFRWVPSVLRNVVYNFVVRHRYAWFGKLEACPVPTPEQRARFLP